MMRPLLQGMRLSVKDFRRDWRMSLCLCLAMAAVMTPLLVLFGIKSGIVSALQNRLVSDPRNREVVIVGNYRLGADWFADLRREAAGRVAIPRTRSLAATLDVRAPSGKTAIGIELIPTAAGDPLVPAGLLKGALASDRVLLSQSAAAQLGVTAGDSLMGQVWRIVEGRREVRRWEMQVAGIIPESLFPRAGLFANIEFLIEIEDWRDGVEPALGPERVFASARLFAADLEDVAPLAETLRRQGLEVRTRAAEIESVRMLDRGLGRIFAVLAALGVGGFTLSLAASLWAAVERKRRDLALMRLIGFNGAALAATPVTQALLVAVGGIALSSLFYLGVAALCNITLAATLAREEFVCRLDPTQYGAAVLLTLSLSAAAAGFAALRAALIDPAESLREV